MAHGLLEVSGTIDLAQFWPGGLEDADTVKVAIVPGAFRFRSTTSDPFKVTNAFDQATVRGTGSKPVIDKTGRVTTRLQGIDAPELHYRPQSPVKLTAAQAAAFKKANGNFRQPFGETATGKLHAFLAGLGKDPLPCTLRSAVDHPNDLFDTYGRAVVDIFVHHGANEIDVNHWLAEQGWAYPTFYASMSNLEIQDLIAASKTAAQKKAGIWGHFSTDASRFDPTVTFRKGGPPDAKADTGPVLMPKIFRRLSTYAGLRTAKAVKGSFKSYLAAHVDSCFRTADFLAQGVAAAGHHHLDEFVSPVAKVGFRPDGLVFQEKPSLLVDASGKPITGWF